MMRFDRFTISAQEAAQRAGEILQHYDHNQIDTEHLLLALIKQPQGVISQLLEMLKIDGNALGERLDYLLRTNPKANIFGGADQIFITPRVKRIIDLASEEANHMHDEYISSEHLFLAILSERNTPAARLLEGSDINRDLVKDAIQQLRGVQQVSDLHNETHNRTLEKPVMNALETLRKEVKNRPSALQNKNQMLGLLNDCFPNEKAKVNQLIAAFDCGVVKELVDSDGKKDFLEQRLTKRIIDDYGYESITAEKIIDTWIQILDRPGLKVEYQKKIQEEVKVKDVVPAQTSKPNPANPPTSSFFTHYKRSGNYSSTRSSRTYYRSSGVLDKIGSISLKIFLLPVISLGLGALLGAYFSIGNSNLFYQNEAIAKWIVGGIDGLVLGLFLYGVEGTNSSKGSRIVVLIISILIGMVVIRYIYWVSVYIMNGLFGAFAFWMRSHGIEYNWDAPAGLQMFCALCGLIGSIYISAKLLPVEGAMWIGGSFFVISLLHGIKAVFDD